MRASRLGALIASAGQVAISAVQIANQLVGFIDLGFMLGEGYFVGSPADTQ
jgi:hypothetical protein